MAARSIIVGVLLACLAGAARADDASRWSELAAQLETARGADAERLRLELIAGGMAAHAALKEGRESTAAARADIRRVIRARRDVAERAKGLVVHEWGGLT